MTSSIEDIRRWPVRSWREAVLFLIYFPRNLRGIKRPRAFSPCNTDSTSEEPLGQMAVKKRGIIIRLMNDFYSIFGLNSGTVTCAGSTSPDPPQGTVPSSSPNAQPSGGKGSKRKATDADLPPGDNNGRDDSNKRPKRGSENRDAGLSTANKFACPYFKRNPRKYQRIRACPGPGWDTLHRLKLAVRICTKVSRD